MASIGYSQRTPASVAQETTVKCIGEQSLNPLPLRVKIEFHFQRVLLAFYYNITHLQIGSH